MFIARRMASLCSGAIPMEASNPYQFSSVALALSARAHRCSIRRGQALPDARSSSTTAIHLMPILFCQLATKPILSVMAAANILLLAVCGYMLLRQPESPLLNPSGDSASHGDSSLALPNSVSARPAESVISAPLPARNSTAVGIPATAFNGDTYHASRPDSEVGQLVESSQSPVGQDDNSNDSAVSVASPEVHQTYTATSAIAGKVSEAAEAIVAPQNASVPLALTTSADGATPSQAAALDHLRQDFVNTVAGNGQPFDSQAYVRTWQNAQQSSDSNFAQQFGTEAFIEAQLAQYHGGQ
jgi:hypothetical protein